MSTAVARVTAVPMSGVVGSEPTGGVRDVRGLQQQQGRHDLLMVTSVDNGGQNCTLKTHPSAMDMVDQLFQVLMTGEGSGHLRGKVQAVPMRQRLLPDSFWSPKSTGKQYHKSKDAPKIKRASKPRNKRSKSAMADSRRVFKPISEHESGDRPSSSTGVRMVSPRTPSRESTKRGSPSVGIGIPMKPKKQRPSPRNEKPLQFSTKSLDQKFSHWFKEDEDGHVALRTDVLCVSDSFERDHHHPSVSSAAAHSRVIEPINMQQVRTDFTSDPLEMSPGFAWRGGDASTWRDPTPDTPASVFEEMMSPTSFDEASEELQLHDSIPLYFGESRGGRASLPNQHQRSHSRSGRMSDGPHGLLSRQRPDSCPELSAGFSGLRTIGTPSIPEHPHHLGPEALAPSALIRPNPAERMRSSQASPPLLTSIHDFEFVAPQPMHEPVSFGSSFHQQHDGWPVEEHHMQAMKGDFVPGTM